MDDPRRHRRLVPNLKRNTHHQPTERRLAPVGRVRSGLEHLKAPQLRGISDEAPAFQPFADGRVNAGQFLEDFRGSGLDGEWVCIGVLG